MNPPENRRKMRRPGVNVGDTVKLRVSDKRDFVALYGTVHEFHADEAFLVTFREARGAAQYVLHLKGHESNGTLLARPGHVNVTRKNPELYDPVEEAKKKGAA